MSRVCRCLLAPVVLGTCFPHGWSLSVVVVIAVQYSRLARGEGDLAFQEIAMRLNCRCGTEDSRYALVIMFHIHLNVYFSTIFVPVIYFKKNVLLNVSCN